MNYTWPLPPKEPQIPHDTLQEPSGHLLAPSRMGIVDDPVLKLLWMRISDCSSDLPKFFELCTVPRWASAPLAPGTYMTFYTISRHTIS